MRMAGALVMEAWVYWTRVVSHLQVWVSQRKMGLVWEVETDV